MSQTLGAESLEGQTLALRATATYLQTVGLTAQYNDSFGIESQPLERAVSGGVELRPLFLGRFASDLERGPAHFDLLLDSLSLGLGVYGAWTRQPPCIDELESCFDHGIDWSVGLEIPLLARASTPFVGLRGSLRLSLAEERLADRPMSSGMLTVTLGYRHLFEAQIVDAGDSLGE